MNQTSDSEYTAASRASFEGSDVNSYRRPRIAIIASNWHANIVLQSVNSIEAEFERSPVAPVVQRIDVPGAFEIPLLARKLAWTGHFDAIIACGLVVDGGIYRHEFVAATVIDALMRVQLETDVPVLSAVLTPHHFHDHEEHQRFFMDHFVTKGTEVARACIAILEVHRSVASRAKS
jgi:6,7-dimethyl-8-ribityllumazine synthase